MLITPCLVEPVERERGALRVLRLAAVLAARLAPLVPVAGHEALRPRQALLVPLAAAPRPVLLHVAAEAVAARRVVTELGAAGAVPAAPLAAVLRTFNMTLDELSSFAKVAIVTMQSLFPGSFPQFLLQIMSLKSLSSSSAPEGGGPHRRRTCNNKRGEMITNLRGKDNVGILNYQCGGGDSDTRVSSPPAPPHGWLPPLCACRRCLGGGGGKEGKWVPRKVGALGIYTCVSTITSAWAAGLGTEKI